MSKSKLPEDIIIPGAYVSNLIDEYCFNEKHRAILKRRYLDEHTFSDIAEEFDMTSRQIQYIVYKQGKKILKLVSNFIDNIDYEKEEEINSSSF